VFERSKKSFNAILSQIGRSATADVVIQLLKVKCLPAFITKYGLNACPLSATENKFLTSSSSECLDKFSTPPPKLLLTNAVLVLYSIVDRHRNRN